MAKNDSNPRRDPRLDKRDPNQPLRSDPRLAAAAAAADQLGSVRGSIVVAGDEGAKIPAGSELVRADGVRFQVLEDAVIGENEEVVVTVGVVGEAQGAPSDHGTALTFDPPLHNVEPEAVVGDGGLVDGAAQGQTAHVLHPSAGMATPSESEKARQELDRNVPNPSFPNDPESGTPCILELMVQGPSVIKVPALIRGRSRLGAIVTAHLPDNRDIRLVDVPDWVSDETPHYPNVRPADAPA